MTFSMLYAFTENFVLPLSHDEVVHGKASLHQQNARRSLAAVRESAAALRVLLRRIPGKKLLFMGGEFGQRAEWNSSTSLEWDLLPSPSIRACSASLPT